MITISLDMTKIDETRIKPYTRKNGDQAEFLELVLIESPNSQYGDYIVKQGVTKEERMAGKEMPIIGDAKIYQPQQRGERAQERQAKPQREVF